MAQGHLKWDQNELIDEKTGCKKSRETVPLKDLFLFIEREKINDLSTDP